LKNQSFAVLGLKNATAAKLIAVFRNLSMFSEYFSNKLTREETIITRKSEFSLKNRTKSILIY